MVGQAQALSSKRLSSLSDYSRLGYKLRLDCSCGRVVIFDPRTLLAYCHKHSLLHGLEQVSARLKCGDCGKRSNRVGPAFGD